MSPTARALAHCRKMGWTAQVVEKWNHHAGVRVDLFGCIDLVVLDGQPGGPLGVQVTTWQNTSKRLRKMRDEERMVSWLQAPARLEIWGLRQAPKVKKDGTKSAQYVWEIRRIVVDLALLAPVN